MSDVTYRTVDVQDMAAEEIRDAKDNGLDPRDVLLWNIFPFHPHKTSPFSNRTPTDSELADALVYAKALLSYCRPDIRLAAIGRKSAETLQNAGFPAIAMRHPANGGAGLFREQFTRFSR